MTKPGHSLCIVHYALCIAVAVVSANAETTATSTAAPIAVDVDGGPIRTIAPRDIGYSPRWGGVTDAGAHVVILKVEHAGTANAVTSVVANCTADAEGVEALTVVDGGEHCFRLIHRVYDANDAEKGKPLVRDVSFGYASAALPDVFADTRENSLEEAVATTARTKSPVMLTYDTAWATNGTPDDVTVMAVRLTGEGGAAVGTNAFFSAAASAKGEAPLRRVSPGWMRLVCRVADTQDATLLEYVTDDFLLKPLATTLFVR